MQVAYASPDDVMDTRVLLELLQLLGPSGPELLRSIIELYEAETPPALASLGLALERGDCNTAMRLAHRLKGSCLSIGASRLATSCGAVEEACRYGVVPSDTAFKTLCTYFEATRSALHRFLAELHT